MSHTGTRDDMEAADRDFIRAIQYISASCRLHDWSDDDVTESKLRRLARSYSERAMGLVLEGVADAIRDDVGPRGWAGERGSFRPARSAEGKGPAGW